MLKNIENISEHLRTNDVKPSFQRIKIFEYLIKYKNHPTIDTIYKAIKPEIPTLSKTTVYNTLNLFIEKSVVQLIMIEENETRYDADTSLHGHFKCKTCGEIYDFNINIDNIKFEGLEGFNLEEHHLYSFGICKPCSIKKGN